MSGNLASAIPDNFVTETLRLPSLQPIVRRVEVAAAECARPSCHPASSVTSLHFVPLTFAGWVN